MVYTDLKCNSLLHDRVKKLLVTLNLSDCSFLVSGREFKAHKLILAISSPVFEAMLYGSLSSDNSVIIEDIEPDVFQLMLSYIYTDTIKIDSVEHALEILYASRKYFLEGLTQMCIEFIQDSMTIDDVITVLNYSEYIQDKNLTTHAIELFCEHAKHLFENKMSIISTTCMKTILESNHINISEKDLIEHVFEWTRYNCQEKNIWDTIENRRNVINQNGIFQLLRFLVLSLDELDDIINNENNLLLTSEFENIKKLISTEDFSEINSNPFGSTLTPRNTIKPKWHLCQRSTLRSVAPTLIDQNNHVIHFRIKTNKSIFLNSIIVPTSLSPWADLINCPKVYVEVFSVKILRESDNSVINISEFMSKVDYNSSAEAELSELCFIKKKTWHTISFVWPHNKCQMFYSGTHKDKVYKDHKITINFDDMCIYPRGSFVEGLKFCF